MLINVDISAHSNSSAEHPLAPNLCRPRTVPCIPSLDDSTSGTWVMYVPSCAHLLYKLSNLQLVTGALIGPVLLYTGQPAVSIFPKTRLVPYDPSLHPACVGRPVSICNGLGLKLKVLSFTQTAVQPHRLLCCQWFTLFSIFMYDYLSLILSLSL